MQLKKPFVIKRAKLGEPLIPTTSDLYDQTQQNRIQIVQAANGYLTINMLYESFKLMWSFWHYQTNCPDYAYLSLGFMILNIIWALCSYLGFKAIRSKNSRNIKIFGYTVFGNFLLRIIMYIVCGIVMKGYSTSYINITPEQYNDAMCNALYPQALFVISGIIQALLCLLIMFMTTSIYQYVVRWESSETQKHMPAKFNDLSNY